MLVLIIEILKALFAGEFKSLWIAHKNAEAKDAKNDAASMPDVAVTERLRDKWERD
jgi:hypothetical protein